MDGTSVEGLKERNEWLTDKVKELEKKLADMKNFWKPIIDKFETKYPNAGNANTVALTALTEAFDIHCKNEELEKKLAVAKELLETRYDTLENSRNYNRSKVKTLEHLSLERALKEIGEV